MGKPAARLTDPTAHGGLIVGPGVPTVLIGKMPAATMGDNHVCPMVTPAVPPIPHVGGPIILGSTGVFIGKKPAARMGDMAVCVGPPSSIIMGCPTVLIGEAGSGSQASSAGSAAAAQVSPVSRPKDVSPVKPPKSESKTSESHSIHLKFRDAAGKPLEGIVFSLKDPEGNITRGSSRGDGDWTLGGIAKKGSFEVRVPSLDKVDVDKKRLSPGESISIKASAKDFPPDEPAWVILELETPDGQCHVLSRFETSIQNDQIKLECKLDQGSLDQLAAQGISVDGAKLSVQVGAGFQCAFSPALDIVPGKAKREVKFAVIPTECWVEKSIIPVPDPDGILLETFRKAIKRGSQTVGEELFLFSHADASDSVGAFQLATDRGAMVRSLLMRDATAWVSLAVRRATEDDLKALADGLVSCGFEMEEPEGDMSQYLSCFWEAFAERYQATPPRELSMDTRTWTALHRAMCGRIAEQVLRGSDPRSESLPDWTLPRLAATAQKGVVSCGKSFPLAFPNKEDWKGSGLSRVEIAFAPRGTVCLPSPKGSDKDLTITDVPCFDPDKTTWTPLMDLQVAGFRFSS